MLEEISRYFHHEQQPPPAEFSAEIMAAVKVYSETDIASHERLTAYHELERLLPDQNKRRVAIASYRKSPEERSH